MAEAKRRRMVRGAVDRVGVSTRQMASTFGLSQSCVVKIMQIEAVKHDKRQKALHMSNEQETRTKRYCKKIAFKRAMILSSLWMMSPISPFTTTASLKTLDILLLTKAQRL